MNVVKNSLVKIGRHDDSKTISRRKPCYRQYDLFSNSLWLYCLQAIFTIPLVAHYPKLLACQGSLKRKVLKKYKII